MNANTDSTPALALHLAAINARVAAWVAEDPASRWGAGPVEDLAFWAERGIFTVEQYELDSARAELWDSYKSVHGVKPRWMSIQSMTLAEVRAELANLERVAAWQREAREADARERVREANARALARRRAAASVESGFTLAAAWPS